jgi:UDP-N-acetylmuramoyl-tripeptide--D-alanyl-D-alanine ligase
MADGVTFIQDTWKAPVYTVPASLRVMETARAPRKIVIIGTVTDSRKSASKTYRDIAKQALEVADHVIFTGRWAASAIKGHPPQDGQRLLGFNDIYELRNFLPGFLAPGDLVLLKGSTPTDHLERLVLDWEREFPCWRLDCKRYMHCTDCRLRGSHFVPGS